MVKYGIEIAKEVGACVAREAITLETEGAPLTCWPSCSNHANALETILHVFLYMQDDQEDQVPDVLNSQLLQEEKLTVMDV